MSLLATPAPCLPKPWAGRSEILVSAGDFSSDGRPSCVRRGTGCPAPEREGNLGSAAGRGRRRFPGRRKDYP